MVSSKFATLEDKQKLIAKVREAAKEVVGEEGLKQLAISPQCGFSSTVHGNEITKETQFEKLKLCREVAEEVWSDTV